MKRWTAPPTGASSPAGDPAPTVEALRPTPRPASATPFVPLAPDTAQPSPIASATLTQTPAATATETSISTTAVLASETSSPAPSVTTTIATALPATLSRTPTRTRTPTRRPSRTPTPEAPSPTWTASATPEGWAETATADGPLTATIAPPSSTPVSGCAATGNSVYESTLLALINQERESRGLGAYRSQSQLQAAARAHSLDMACNGFLSHTGSDGSSVRDRVEREGYDWSWIGENIFATGDTSLGAPQRAFDWWMNSAPHRANLLSPNYTEIGLGYDYLAGSGYGGYFTAVFARP
ncbi:MAG: CAP domain-containing protein [Anaerolineales bacterium]|nr:CAP domain-containing protein [Anaerolineales bacterium]